MTKPIWKPSEKRISSSRMMQFIKYLHQYHHIEVKNYQELYEWSIQYPEKFWPELWRFAGIKAKKLWDKVLINSNEMLNARWFTNSELNFAENLLSRHDEKIALIAVNENGERRTLTYKELYHQVAQLAAALKKFGVTTNDRIVGVMPNIPETVIAMLAATSIGAIWSTCSPDFGAEAIINRFKQIEPKILFITDNQSYNGKIFDNIPKIQKIKKQLPQLEKTIIITKNSKLKSSDKIFLWNDIFSSNTDEKIAFTYLPFDHPVYILYSSGTTGVPKCITHGAGGTLIQHLKELILHTNLKASDIIFYYTTCGWMMWNWMISSLATGATVVLYDGSAFYPNPSALLDLIEKEKVTIFGTSAKYISAIEKAGIEPFKTYKLNSLKTILSTGSPLVSENYTYIYQKVKRDVQLSSISGGTDIISCFALGNPTLPVYAGELQCIGLGMNVKIFNEQGEPIIGEKGELVCTAPFPSMPVYFWNDPDNTKYHKAYFEKFPHVWAHGDYAKITEHHGLIIYGRSDAILNPGGIRIGTAEIYEQVEKIPEILESVAVEQAWQNDTRIILFIKLSENISLTEELIKKIENTIRENTSPHHVPAKILQVADIPKTISGKTVELSIRDIIHKRPVQNIDALANPEALNYFKDRKELKN